MNYVDNDMKNYQVIAKVCGRCGAKRTLHDSVRPDVRSRADSARSDLLKHLMDAHKARSGIEIFSQVVCTNNDLELITPVGAALHYQHDACGELIATLRGVLTHTCKQRVEGSAYKPEGAVEEEAAA